MNERHDATITLLGESPFTLSGAVSATVEEVRDFNAILGLKP